MSENTRTSALTPAMKITIAVVSVLVVGGLVMAAGLSGLWKPVADAEPTQTQTQAPSASAPQSAGPLPGATPTEGSEVLPPTAGSSDGVPPPVRSMPLVGAPLPETGSRSGELVPDFPADIVDVLPESSIISSSIATESTVMQVSLVASVTATSDEIRAHYRSLWTSLGLREESSDGTTTTFSGPFESLTLTLDATGTGNRYTIFAVFRTE